METSTVDLDSSPISLDAAVLSQVGIMLVSSTQTAILLVTARKRLLRGTQSGDKEMKKGEPAFKPFGDEELERETF